MSPRARTTSTRSEATGARAYECYSERICLGKYIYTSETIKQSVGTNVYYKWKASTCVRGYIRACERSHDQFNSLIRHMVAYSAGAVPDDKDV